MMVLQDAAKPGSLVKKGHVVAEFDRQYMMTRIDDYKAGVVQNEAAYKKLLAEIDVNKKMHNQAIAKAEAEFEKANLDMKTLPVLSDMDSERRRLALEEAEAYLKQVRAEVRHVDAGQAADKKIADFELRESQLELRRAEANAARMEVKAPIDGLVVMQNMFRGSEFDQIKVGDQLYPGMMFMQIVDPSSMVINASVSQVDVEKLRIGLKARVRFDAFPGLELPARVFAIGSVAKSSRYRPDWVKDIPVAVKIEKMDPRVIPDLSVSVDILLESEEAEVMAPREAFFQDSSGGGSKHYVYVRTVDGNWQKRNVEVGLVGNMAAVIKSGVKPNEVVALEPPGTANPTPVQSARS